MSKTFEQGKDEASKLCQYFSTNREVFLAPGIKEAHIRQTLIDPFFEALGWDVRNTEMKAPQYREVIPEDSLEIEGHQKAPDYTFRIGPMPLFYVEAKKCAVNINTDPGPAYQLRRYGWSAKVALSLLTNFQELAVYDCSFRPKPNDKASHARIKLFNFEEYSDRWRELWDLFSHEACWSGAYDQYAASKRKRGTSEVDVEFLKEIEGWRESLAKNIAIRNKELFSDDLNAAVQLIIDRVVFLRMAEDRGIEPVDQLLKLCEQPDIYARFIKKLCHRADEKYNSGLFHFKKEAGVTENPDQITPKLIVDDKIFKAILQSLYFEHGSPYHFGVMPVEILGTVYERFLGKVIRLTAGHQAKIEEKPEVRKAGGVYYTPSYIVDYIVKHTVKKQIEGRSADQLFGKKGNPPFRVLDMACGSGSFLLGAYQCLLEHYLKWYTDHKPDANKKCVYKDVRSGHYRLTIEEKKRILKTHIFGVDIDLQAVEVSKLSLLLKVLESETGQSIGQQLKLFQEKGLQRVLPNLADNIKCGNSLIGHDYFADKLIPDPEEARRINPFDWAQAFPVAMENGGFDCVIGNPPWGATLSEGELEYLRDRHKRVIARMIDSYIYFIDKAFQIAKNGSPVAYIIPATLLNQVDALPIRNQLLERGIALLVYLGQGIFGKKVLNTSCIFVSSKTDQSIIIDDLSHIPIEKRPIALNILKSHPKRQWEKIVESDPHHTFFTIDLSKSVLLGRLRQKFDTLESFIQGTIQRGVSPDVVAAHIVTNNEAQRLRFEDDLLRHSLSGGQIKRYQPWISDQVIIYTTRRTTIENYPCCYAHLSTFKHLNTCKEVEQGKHSWWMLHRPRNPDIFAAPKLIGLTTTKTIELVFDESANLFVTDAMYVFTPRPKISPKALMGVMQSKLFHFLYNVANIGEARVIPQIKASKLLTLPVPNLTTGSQLAELVDKMLDLYKHLRVSNSAMQKGIIQNQIDATDSEIDGLVYNLYGLTAEEIAIVEE